ncbi:MAG: insulinase family protein [Saprospiraceae bacterium]|nr:insulinase family protein [Saprospiraceae bacterium]
MKGVRIYSPKPFKIPEVGKVILKNGLTVYYLEGGIKNTIKFEWCFKAGRTVEKVHLVSKICHSLLKEGTEKYSGFDIAEHFDYYGSSLNQNAGVDYSSYSFYCLAEYFKPLLERFHDLITGPLFPERDLEIIKQNSISKLHQDLDDADFVSYRIFTEMVFGKYHPYGYNTTENIIKNIDREKIRQHYLNNYLNKAGFVMVSGDIPDALKSFIETCLESIQLKDAGKNLYPEPLTDGLHFFYSRDLGKIQCSYKIGQRSIRRNHPDYIPFFIANSILGGYFNSRLSQVIREKKGLTYDIFSNLDSYLYDGLFYISTETSAEHIAQLRKEVRKQLNLMKDKPVTRAELERNRAYLMGVLISSFDGVFTCADTFRSCIVEGVTFDSLQEMVDKVADITPEEVRESARNHIQPESMIEVVIG